MIHSENSSSGCLFFGRLESSVLVTFLGPPANVGNGWLSKAYVHAAVMWMLNLGFWIAYTPASRAEPHAQLDFWSQENTVYDSSRTMDF